MKQAIIHIGMHKTGTSSIQKAFRGYDDGETRYVRLETANHSQPICAVFMQPPSDRSTFRKGGFRRDLFERRDEIKKNLAKEISLDRSRFIISGESIIHLSAGELTEMLRFLEHKGVSAKFIAYVREPVGFGSSSFQQQVKADRANFLFIQPHYKRRFADFIAVCRS